MTMTIANFWETLEQVWDILTIARSESKHFVWSRQFTSATMGDTSDQDNVDDNASKKSSAHESDEPETQPPVRRPPSLSAFVKKMRKEPPPGQPHSPAPSGHSGQANIEIIHSDYDAEQTDEEGGDGRQRKSSTMGRFVGTLQVLKSWMVREEERTKRADSFLERLAMGGPHVEMSPGGSTPAGGDR